MIDLNARALGRAEALMAIAEERRVAVTEIEGGGRFVDCGIAAKGGLVHSSTGSAGWTS